MNNPVDQITVLNSQKLLHGEAAFYPVLTAFYPVLTAFYPVLTVQAIIKIPPDFPFLNKLIPVGLSPHHLCIEKAMVLMLMLRLTPKKELCNGTRIILIKATNTLLYCRIASGNYAREEMLIPRIQIKCQDEQFIELNRRQFPVTPSIAMTIKKIHGQTLISGILSRGAYILSWAAICRGLTGSRPATSSLGSN